MTQKSLIKKSKNSLIILLFLSTLLLSCESGTNKDSLLNHISRIVADTPEEALSALDSIDYDKLSSPDRHYYDLLSIKAKDKAYIIHESDSLILDVIRYYSSNNKKNIYPEALYYAGRVYCDLGDLPTALRYFQDALHALSENEDNDDLRSCILSQTGRLLDTLRLYDEAIPYIRHAIEIDHVRTDTINEVYDLQLLGMIYMRAQDYIRADSCFRSAMEKSENMPISYRAKTSMYIAELKLQIGQIDSALIYIRNTPDQVKYIARNSALATAADAYHAAGILDSAYLYAHELISSEDPTNKWVGYRVLLSPQLRNMSPKDTLDLYMNEYLMIIESRFNENKNQLTLNQQSYHNYQIHERKRKEAENSNALLIQWLYCISIVLLLMGTVILFLKNKNANDRLKLHAALENVERLRQSLEDKRNLDNKTTSHAEKEITVSTVKKTESTEELREKLRKNLYEIYSNNINRTAIDLLILESETYAKLQKLATDGEFIADNSNLWTELENLVLECSPDFIKKLRLLTVGNLTIYDLHTALLIKCGIQPTQMSVLLNRSKGTIVSRRESLCMKVFDEKLGTKVIDSIIRLL